MTGRNLSQPAVLAALQKNFPHTIALLKAIPLTAVSAELPGVVRTLGPGVTTVIPNLVPTIVNAPAVTVGWNNVPGTAALTRFDGTPVKTVFLARRIPTDRATRIASRRAATPVGTH